MTFFFRWMTELTSRKWLSQLTGAVAKSTVSRVFIRSFAKTYQIHVDEAEQPLEAYRSLNDFFTRRLKAGARSIDVSSGVVVSPVDARITGIGKIEDGMMLQIKGQDYTIAEMLQDESRAQQFAHGYFFVLYLSPRDYHRIHVPINGTITEKRHLPGKVYPVNEFGLRKMKRVLSRNERLLTYIRPHADTSSATGEIAVVKVGALNVSSIRFVPKLSDIVESGSELAYFEFGSTIVLLIENRHFQVRAGLEVDQVVKMGEALGYLPTSESSDGN